MIQLKTTRTQWITGLAIAAMVTVVQLPASAARQQSPAGCRVTGRVTSLVAAPAGLFPGRGRSGQDPTAAEPAAQVAPAAPSTVAQAVSGATIAVRQGDRLVVVTSADANGRFSILFTPGQTFRVSAEMTSFGTIAKDLTLGALPCDTTLDFDLPLLPRSDAVVGRGTGVDSGNRALHGAPRHL